MITLRVSQMVNGREKELYRNSIQADDDFSFSLMLSAMRVLYPNSIITFNCF